MSVAGFDLLLDCHTYAECGQPDTYLCLATELCRRCPCSHLSVVVSPSSGTGVGELAQQWPFLSPGVQWWMKMR